MKLLESHTEPSEELAESAALVTETILIGMKTIDCEMNHRRPVGVSVPQFRVLGFIKHHPGVSLSLVADHIGLTLPSMSSTVDGLVKRGLVIREPSTEDRRRVALNLTNDGQEAFESAARSARSRIAEILARLPSEKRTEVIKSMACLRDLFLEARPGKCRK